MNQPRLTRGRVASGPFAFGSGLNGARSSSRGLRWSSSHQTLHFPKSIHAVQTLKVLAQSPLSQNPMMLPNNSAPKRTACDRLRMTGVPSPTIPLRRDRPSEVFFRGGISYEGELKKNTRSNTKNSSSIPEVNACAHELERTN